ncbi:MAG: hypothetical protein M1823_003422 [Watsoniomyces obsoletus]|nr:MAG: hypothetical protein M1823_003422 [Watsoniomyces obsoletus]
MSNSIKPNPSYPELLTYLRSYPPPLLPPGTPFNTNLSDPIASLSLHPALEVGLHLFNADLVSAHFLVRHMQAPPAYEGMFLHGILHRIEGDYDNARAWYRGVCETEVFGSVWDSVDDALAFIDDVEKLKRKGQGEKIRLEEQSRREIEGVMRWSENRFGMERWEDATKVWVQPGDKIRQMGQDMVTGDKGRRQF